MQTHEYIVIPAPRKAVSSKGVKGTPARFANAVSILINEMAAEGWAYQRTDTLPCEERQGLTGKAVKYHALMVFSRLVAQDAADEERLALPGPDEEDEAVDEKTSGIEEEAVAEENAPDGDDDGDGDGEETSTRDV